MSRSSSRSEVFWLILTVLTVLVYSLIYDWYTMPGNMNNKVFGVSCMTLNNPFYEVIDDELRKAVESKGDDLLILDPMLDSKKQEEQINRMIEQKVDGIFLNPVDARALESCIHNAAASGIPLVVIDCPIEQPQLADATIVSDNWLAGELCAKDMLSSRESAKILLLEHSEAKSAKDRIEAFLSVIDGKEQYEVADRKECAGQLELAMPAVMESLAAHPEIDVIMALNDPSALGASAAAELAGAQGISIYGVDGTPDFKRKLGENSLLKATVAQSPRSIAKSAAATMYRILDGKNVERETILPVELISASNVDRYSLNGWQ